MTNQLLKKMVTKDVMGDTFNPKELVDSVGEKELYSVFGVCNGIVPDETNYGTFFRLLGTFEAHRFGIEGAEKDKDGKQTGKTIVFSEENTFVSGVCILPDPAGNLFGQQLMSIIAEQKQAGQDVKIGDKVKKRYDVASAQFAVIVGVKPSKKGPRGYEWTVRPLVAPAGVDTLSDLRHKVQAALPAPKAEVPGQPKKK